MPPSLRLRRAKEAPARRRASSVLPRQIGRWTSDVGMTKQNRPLVPLSGRFQLFSVFSHHHYGRWVAPAARTIRTNSTHTGPVIFAALQAGEFHSTRVPEDPAIGPPACVWIERVLHLITLGAIDGIAQLPASLTRSLRARKLKANRRQLYGLRRRLYCPASKLDRPAS